jgi:hypothetical protein
MGKAASQARKERTGARYQQDLEVELAILYSTDECVPFARRELQDALTRKVLGVLNVDVVILGGSANLDTVVPAGTRSGRLLPDDVVHVFPFDLGVREP